MANMLAGFLLSGITLPVDLLGKLVLNILTDVWLVYLALKIRRRQATPTRLAGVVED